MQAAGAVEEVLPGMFPRTLWLDGHRVRIRVDRCCWGALEAISRSDGIDVATAPGHALAHGPGRSAASRVRTYVVSSLMRQVRVAMG